jgi:superfamily II DNA/RNA helicase
MIKFTDLKLDAKVQKAIVDAGYDTPTPIQAGAIPPALEGKDVLGIAQTGTGKTASFTLPMITMLGRGRARARMPRSLVLAPTRELAAQVAENFDIYAKYTKLTKALLIGGVSFKEQDQLIDRGVDVLIATPGRLLDHFERGKLILSDVKVMVVDEADRMLDMGFIPDIERIFQMTPFTRQTLFFSATMAPEIERITNTFLSNPTKVEVARAATTSETITQGVVMFKPSRKDREGSEKRKLLRALIESEGENCRNGIIFCNRKTDVDITAKSLKKYGYDAAPIHGDLDQSKRMETLAKFRDGTLRFLCASDVAARGLDIPNVSHVFNFDVPSHAEDYVHRIGRTGRAGKLGTAMMICSTRDDKNFADVERLVKMEIPRLDDPTASSKSSSSQSTAPKDDGAPKSSSKPKTEKPRTEKPKADTPKTDERTEAPKDTKPKSSHSDKPAKAAKTDAKPTQHSNSSSKSRHSNSSRNSGNQNTPAGMGDHMPTFIAQSFDERRKK